eukprot:TRINITY_DN7544_c0_g1_i1.p1 TRINITY_DN7544_c0_g1~~TRINITY_DN7544_c0_g1_i1.p1  ORF type:complete len:544 (+),score=84.27 TRINITY_DN7544_c0_g1_i1:256-1887(+)
MMMTIPSLSLSILCLAGLSDAMNPQPASTHQQFAAGDELLMDWQEPEDTDDVAAWKQDVAPTVPESVLLQGQQRRQDLPLQQKQKDQNKKGQAPSHDAPGTHPFWHFETFYLMRAQAYLCSVVLTLAGVLCAAGGIGGGGIYVTVLMVAGGLSVHDAVPLSKSVVFFGSMSSLVLNLRKRTAASEGGESLIDYNICRLVVPSSLIGTYLGVLLNSILPSWVILSFLCIVLLGMSWMISRNTYNQYLKEEEEAACGGDGGNGTNVRELSSNGGPTNDNAAGNPGGAEKQKQFCSRNNLTNTEISIALLMLFLIIIGSVTRSHAQACQEAVNAAQKNHECNHPVFFFLPDGTLESWVASPSTAGFIQVFCFAGPLLFCCTVLTYGTSQVLASGRDWTLATALKFEVMSVVTGCLAGLVGIGGGLIFSPFFLLMHVPAPVAVATSSTCVVFTSSSTTFQYLLTDRIIMSLTVLYGFVNLGASYLGTSLVHLLQDHFHARKSYISLIVAVGVVISTILAIIKLVQTAVETPTGSSTAVAFLQAAAGG